MDDAFYKRIQKHAKKRHQSASGWLSAAAEEKLEREEPDSAPAKKHKT